MIKIREVLYASFNYQSSLKTSASYVSKKQKPLRLNGGAS
jgi:hypothetical protein